jgi:hypothetical protein
MNLATFDLESELTRMIAWTIQRCPSPPPHLIKIATLEHYARVYDCKIFIETGSGSGVTTTQMAALGLACHTIELDTPRFLQVRDRFANTANVTVHHGDSEEILPALLASLGTRALFWLDAHYSWDGLQRAPKETPIVAEALAILRHPIKDHVILIDDMRLFGKPVGERYRDYPTVGELQSLFSDMPVDMEILYDIMRITPRHTRPKA